MQTKNIIRIALLTAFILLLPLLAMQFTDEVVWDSTDFAIAGLLIFGAGLAYELAAKKVGTRNTVSWIFGIAFFTIGILNMFLVHLVPGIFYILLSSIYLPSTNTLLKQKLNISIPFIVKIILGLVVIWATLAVGDLAEILGL